MTTVSEMLPAAEAIAEGRHGDPFAVLGPHVGKEGVTIRAFAPGSVKAWVATDAGETAMTGVGVDGFWEATLPGQEIPAYRLMFENAAGDGWVIDDPYAFGPTLTEYDLYLLGEGTHYHSYERLGSHVDRRVGPGGGEVAGVRFAVWAPNAQRVSVVGDFNQWDGRRHPMRKHAGTGVWDVFLPGVTEGSHYKYEIVGPDGTLLPLRTDPQAFRYEMRPQTAAVVDSISGYDWGDDAWMQDRPRRHERDQPISIYELHLASWLRSPDDPDGFLSYTDLADKLVDYVRKMNFTHVELMPVTEHPYDGSWGYQTLGYFAPTSRFGPPQDFMKLVDTLHQAGIGVIVDWVPAHFPKDAHGLRHFDGTAVYEHADPRQGEHPEWGTQIFNYGRNEVRNFLVSSALFWCERYHIDGIRVDAVASMLYLDYGREEGDWLPNRHGGKENLEAIEFLRQFNDQVHTRFPGVLTCAEESTSWGGVTMPPYAGGLGFNLKWNMGWMNDTLRYMHRDSSHRKYHQNDLTFSLVYAFSENFLLPLSHDEVVHGKGSLLDKMPGDEWQEFANLRLLYGYMWTHPGKKLLFMGCEFAQGIEWKYASSLDWHLLERPQHEGVRQCVADLNELLVAEKSLHQRDHEAGGFEWVDFHDHDGSTIAFLRRGVAEDDFLLVVCNFTPTTRPDYRLGIPAGGSYTLAFNSDAQKYGGSGVGETRIKAAAEPWGHFPHTLTFTLPPLAAVVYRPE